LKISLSINAGAQLQEVAMFTLDYNEELVHQLMVIISETVEGINVVQENTMENMIRDTLRLYEYILCLMLIRIQQR
jgi:hypothetical protein